MSLGLSHIEKKISWDITSERKLNMAIGVIDFVAGLVKAGMREVVVD